MPQSTVHDVTFDGLDIKPQPGMGFAMGGRDYDGPRQTNYYNIKIINSIIEPDGGENISFDGEGTDILVENTILEGSTTSDLYPWHQSLEFNGTTHSSAIGNTFYAARGAWLNLSCDSGVVCADDIENNTFDMTVNIDGITMDPSDYAWMYDTAGSTFKNNFVKINAGGGFIYLVAGSTNNTYIGNTFWDTRNPTYNGSWINDHSTGNVFSGNTFISNFAYPSWPCVIDHSSPCPLLYHRFHFQCHLYW